MLPIPEKNIGDYIGYNPEIGSLTWLQNKGTSKAGDIINPSKSRNGYARFRFNGKLYLGHRVAWFLYYNEQPPERIDHDNRCRSDNRIENLRDATPLLNSQNAEALGYYWHKKFNCFQSQYIKEGKKINLGLFECPLMARLAYLDAKLSEDVKLPLLPTNGTITGRQGEFVRKQGHHKPSGLGYTWANNGFQVTVDGHYVGYEKCPLLARYLRVDKVRELQGIDIPFLPDCQIKGRAVPLKEARRLSKKSIRRNTLGYSWVSGRFVVTVRSKVVGREYCPLLARILRVEKLKELESADVSFLPETTIRGRKDFRPLPRAK